MIDRTPPNEMPPVDERNVREVRSTSGASWFLAGLAVVVVVVGGIFLFSDDYGGSASETTVNMQAPPPATQSQPEAPQAAPDNGSSGQSAPSPTAPASE